MARSHRLLGPRTAIALGSVLASVAIWSTAARGQAGVTDITIDGDHFAFAPAKIEVPRDSLVKVTFRSHDIAHSFVVDGYRISKRAAAGQSVTFEFRADQAGSFPFYCNLSQDERCRAMRGELVVK